MSDGWEKQLVQLNKIYLCFDSANELERTGVGGGDIKKRSRYQDDTDESLGVRQLVSKTACCDTLHDILQNVANLVCLIEAGNEFVRHSVKKTLIAISDHLILKAQMSSWCSLLHHIWNVLTLGCVKAQMIETHNIEKDKSNFHSAKQSVDCYVNDSLHLEKNSGTLVCGLEILRCILKSCYNDNDNVNEHTEVFLALLEEKLHTIVKIICPETNNPGDSLCSGRRLAWAALLQLLCTAIACCDREAEDSISASTELQFLLIEKIGGCIPVIAVIALSPHRHPSSVNCPSSFLRHKALVQRLMIGLSRWFEVKHNLALLCLRALRKEGADLINFPLLGDSACSRDNNLMRSSFLTSSINNLEKVGNFLPRSATHLRCRALLLLFRIWSLTAEEPEPGQAVRQQAFQVDGLNRKNPEDRKEFEDRASQVNAWISHHGRNCLLLSVVSGASYRDGGSLASTGNHGSIPNSCQSANLSEEALKQEANIGIQDWLRLQSDAVPVGKIEDFSMAFVGLYLDEDDLMIEMLLLLVRLRSSLLVIVDTDLKTTFPIASELDPAKLLHAFLQTLSYDHTVLIEFLISQSTGTLFLRYLMLCIGIFIKPEFYKLIDHSHVAGAYRIGSRGIEEKSLNCLSQLKIAIERLHRRKLFPYNPSALLKRLGVLGELYQRA